MRDKGLRKVYKCFINPYEHHMGDSPLLGGDDEQVVEEEEVDGGELVTQVEKGAPFGHLL